MARRPRRFAMVAVATSVVLLASVVPVFGPSSSARPLDLTPTDPWHDVGGSEFEDGVISADVVTNATHPVGYRLDGTGATTLRGAAFAMGASARPRVDGSYTVPVLSLPCGWRPDRRVVASANVGSATGSLQAAALQVDPTGLVSVRIGTGDAIGGSTDLPTFTGFVPLDGVSFEADADETCPEDPPAVEVLPAARYGQADVFDEIEIHDPEVYAADFPANVAANGGPAGPFELEFQRFEPDPDHDPMVTDRKAVVILNGGGFALGDDEGRAQQEEAAKAWARAGWVAFTVEYPAYPTLTRYWSVDFTALSAVDPLRQEIRDANRGAMEGSVLAVLTFWDYLADHAAAWGVDIDATAVSGWSASGISVIEMLAARYRTESFPENDPPTFDHFPQFHLSLSAGWYPAVDVDWDPYLVPSEDPATVAVTTDESVSLVMIHFLHDQTWDATRWQANCSAIAESLDPVGPARCTSIELDDSADPGAYHDLWQPVEGPATPTEVESAVPCFDEDGDPVVPGVPGCSVLDEVLPLADAATPQD